MRKLLLTTAAAVTFSLPALACELEVHDAYARTSTAMSQSGAVFMHIANHADTDCRITGARSDAAQRVELHTHLEDADGVMRMVEIEGGITVPAQGEHKLARGGDHVMFLGLNQPLHHGDQIAVTLVLENGDDLELAIPVDLERTADHGGDCGHEHSHNH
ncbi:copper chaperone PCu(A)C [Roseinatronobacter alkalisoli]|uniref:Copper chaperone PCu(A)C n=1 Tax=Roseinatronobacter alkalisoli TaxID=3028235 RepID=A0ABT5TD49_9RHOB|nr:copper chaperone PCu(A)C [Roseinatronobacter sp. HJB301]MDD7971838.1 copper chaperone PCu(A)C [Roseinatronobacter sp. HJB301]